MERRTAKIALLVVALASATWLGGSTIRAIVGFDLLQVGTLDFKPNIHPYVERAIFGLIAQSSAVVDVAYIVLWLSGIVYLRSTHLRLREEGWLMMTAIFFYMFTPVEIYTMVLDTRMWMMEISGSNDLVEFRTLFIHRLGALSGVPMIASLCYYTSVGLIVFRPFQRRASGISGPGDQPGGARPQQ